jgi:hypothetical protein
MLDWEPALHADARALIVSRTHVTKVNGWTTMFGCGEPGSGLPLTCRMQRDIYGAHKSKTFASSVRIDVHRRTKPNVSLRTVRV